MSEGPSFVSQLGCVRFPPVARFMTWSRQPTAPLPPPSQRRRQGRTAGEVDPGLRDRRCPAAGLEIGSRRRRTPRRRPSGGAHSYHPLRTTRPCQNLCRLHHRRAAEQKVNRRRGGLQTHPKLDSITPLVTPSTIRCQKQELTPFRNRRGRRRETSFDLSIYQ